MNASKNKGENLYLQYIPYSNSFKLDGEIFVHIFEAAKGSNATRYLTDMWCTIKNANNKSIHRK